MKRGKLLQITTIGTTLCDKELSKNRRDSLHADHVITSGGGKFQVGSLGFGQMGIASSLCFRCQTACAPFEILPGRRTEGTPSRNVHSCLCHNCFNRADGPIIEASCVHPRSLERQVVHASLQHFSTGSTVDTFLTQDDLASLASDFEPTLADIDE
ncbi:Hypothetical predicted protein [Mytilus galloprovincialis]|uniref:Uncharacterized protein n=1 Tax=Mytilus galloprovincialis TaxID=29158 RepID=A0A8B6FP61_MYTGA|nr:Hypothetical predicted protein [Mytilus galloprovincialis]